MQILNPEKPSVLVELTSERLTIQVNLLSGYLNRNEPKTKEMVAKGLLFMNFDEEESQQFFEKFRCSEINDKNLVQFVQDIFLQREDKYFDFKIDDNAYQINVVDEDLLKMVNAADSELDKVVATIQVEGDIDE